MSSPSRASNARMGILHESKRAQRLAAVAVAALLIASCGASTKTAHSARAAPRGAPPPAWLEGTGIEGQRLCGLGVAGAAFDPHSPYPKQMAEERAVRNLAGILGTTIREAIIDKETQNGTTVQLARVVHIDDALIKAVADMVHTDYWLDVAGIGPFAAKGFTYAQSCIDAADAAGKFKIDAAALVRRAHRSSVSPAHVPRWIHRTGKQSGGRLCAVGYTLPMFFPDRTFEAVVEDVRIQLSKVLSTLVSSYFEEHVTEHSQLIEAMNVAITDEVSKGAVITDYWYDRDGIGPFHTKHTTYGWGCVYPTDVLQTSAQDVAQKVPQPEQPTVAAVRQHAEQAFDALDAEIARHSASAAVPPAATSTAEATPPRREAAPSPDAALAAPPAAPAAQPNTAPATAPAAAPSHATSAPPADTGSASSNGASKPNAAGSPEPTAQTKPTKPAAKTKATKQAAKTKTSDSAASPPTPSAKAAAPDGDTPSAGTQEPR